MPTVNLTLNGRSRSLEIEDLEMPLLLVLRNDVGLHGPRFGCGLGQCGACTVHVDGNPIRSCVFPARAAAVRNVLTLEGSARRRNHMRCKKRSSTSRQCSAATA